MTERPTLVDAYPYPAGEDHWRSMAADEVNHFWFTNREARVLFAEIDRLRAERAALLSQVYIGDHHFPDLTWKARCHEVNDALRRAEAILTTLCQQASDYEDEALPEQLPARIKDLNNRRVKAEATLAAIRALPTWQIGTLRRMLAEMPKVRGRVTMEAEALAGVLALLDAAPKETL